MALNKNKVIAAAQRYAQKGQLDRAISELRTVVEEDPEDVRVWHRIADLQIRKGSVNQAIATYHRIARHYEDRGFFLKGVAVYKQILAADPTLVDVHRQLGELYVKLGLGPEAVGQFQIVVGTYEREGRHQDSLELLEKIVELGPEDESNRIRLAEGYARQSHNDRAIAEFKRTLHDLRDKSRHEDYVQVAERLLYLYPDELDVVRALSEIYLERGDPKRALARLQILFRADPTDPLTLDLLARAFTEIGQTAKAVSVYRELARIHGEAGDQTGQQAAWVRLLEIEPDDPEGLAATGGVARGAASLSSGAQNVAGLGGERRGESVERHLADADLLLKYELRDHARERLQLALALEPLNEAALTKKRDLALADERVDDAASALMRLADSAERSGDAQKAMKWLGELLQLRPGDPEAAERMRRMSSGMARELATSAEPIGHEPDLDLGGDYDAGADYDVDLGEIDFDGSVDDDLPAGGFALDLDALDASVDDEFADLLSDAPAPAPAPRASRAIVPDAPPGIIVPDAPADDAFGDLLADEPPAADDAFGDLLADEPPAADDAFGDLLADDPPAADDAFGDLLADAPPADDAFGDLLADAPPPADDAFGDLLADGPAPADDAFGDLLADAPAEPDAPFGDLLAASVEAPGAMPVIVPDADDEPLVDAQDDEDPLAVDHGDPLDDLGGLDLDAPDHDEPADDLGGLDLDAPGDDDAPVGPRFDDFDFDAPDHDEPADDLGGLDLDDPADDAAAEPVGFMTDLPAPEALPDEDEFADLLLEGSGAAPEPDFGIYQSTDDLPLTSATRLPPLSDAPAEIDIDIDVSENMPQVDVDYGDESDLSIEMPASVSELPPPPPPPSARRAADLPPPPPPPSVDDDAGDDEDEIEELDLDEIDIIELDDDDMVLEDDSVDEPAPDMPPAPSLPPPPPPFEPAEAGDDAGDDDHAGFGFDDDSVDESADDSADDSADESADDSADDVGGDATVVVGADFDLSAYDLGDDDDASEATTPPGVATDDAPEADDDLGALGDLDGEATPRPVDDYLSDDADVFAPAPRGEVAAEEDGLAGDPAAGGKPSDTVLADAIVDDGLAADAIAADADAPVSVEALGEDPLEDAGEDDPRGDATQMVDVIDDGFGDSVDEPAPADDAPPADDQGEAPTSMGSDTAAVDVISDEPPAEADPAADADLDLDAASADAVDDAPALDDADDDADDDAAGEAATLDAPADAPAADERPAPPSAPAPSVADRLNALRPKRTPAAPRPLSASNLSLGLRGAPPPPPAPLPGAPTTPRPASSAPTPTAPAPAAPAPTAPTQPRQALLRPPPSTPSRPVTAPPDAEPSMDDRTEAGGLPTDEPALLAPPDDAPADLSEELAELDFLIESGLADEADELLRELEANNPDHPALADRRAQLAAAAPLAAEPTDDAEPGAADDATEHPPEGAQLDGDDFDAESLLSGLDDDFDFDFSEVQGAELADIRDDEADTHFDLGMAFREMGQHHKAIAELELAARSPDKRFDAQRIIALCHLEMGDTDTAVTVLRGALTAPQLDAAARAHLRYDLATALEQQGDPAGARAQLEEIAASGLPDFLDLRARLDALS
ncbi:MAG: tetratricopeptide repeat protein [bacterium]